MPLTNEQKQEIIKNTATAKRFRKAGSSGHHSHKRIMICQHYISVYLKRPSFKKRTAYDGRKEKKFSSRYLENNDVERYRKIIKELDIRK